METAPKVPDPPPPAPPPSVFQDSRLLTKEHFIYDTRIHDPSSHGLVDGVEATRDKVTAVYFSASWCPPCRQFTPVLRQMFEELRERDAPLQIVFVSFDKTIEHMEEYYLSQHGDWLAVHFDDPLKDNLVSKFNINVIPKLIVLRPDGEVITVRGRKEVQDKGMICFRNWMSSASLSASLSITSAASSKDRKEEHDGVEEISSRSR